TQLLVAQAASRLDRGLPSEREVRMAKAKASEVIPTLLRLAHQVTGGIGYYQGYPLERYSRRALKLAASCGNAREHRRRRAELRRVDSSTLCHDDGHGAGGLR